MLSLCYKLVMGKKPFKLLEGGKGQTAPDLAAEESTHKYQVIEPESIYWEMAAEAAQMKMKFPDYVRWLHRNRSHTLKTMKPELFGGRENE